MTIKDFLELSKPRIGTLILVTSLIGFFFASGSTVNWIAFATLCLGTFCSCSGAAMLNNYIEKDLDALMERTKNRALPAGRVAPRTVLVSGILLVLTGVAILWQGCNLLTAFLSLLTTFLYVLIYTPLKRLTTLNTIIGAIPGALPAAGGVAAATGQLDFSALVLFILLFVWQMPHFFSIAWLCKEDYQRAGFRMLPSVEKNGDLTVAQIIAYSILLIPISFLPLLQTNFDIIYIVSAVFAAWLLIWSGIQFAKVRDAARAKAVLRASLYYFPILLLGGLFDRWIF